MRRIVHPLGRALGALALALAVPAIPVSASPSASPTPGAVADAAVLPESGDGSCLLTTDQSAGWSSSCLLRSLGMPQPGAPLQPLRPGSAPDVATPPPGACVPVPVLDDHCEAWTAEYDHNPGRDAVPPELRGGPDVPVDIAVSPTGDRVFATGWSWKGGTEPPGKRPWNKVDLDWLTVAFDQASGQQLWTARMDSGAGKTALDAVMAVEVSPDGSTVYVTGGQGLRNPNDGDMVTAAYNAATGASVWTAVHDGPQSALDVATGMTLSGDGATVYVTGLRNSRWPVPDGAPLGESLLVAYDARSGRQLWLTTGPDWFMSAVTVSPDGSQLVTVNVGGGVRAYDAATGIELWAETFGRGVGDDLVAAPVGVAVSAAGVYVSGSRLYKHPTHGNFGEFLTVAYAPDTGERLWAQTYGPDAGYNFATGLALAPDGSRVYVTGATAGVAWTTTSNNTPNNRFSDSQNGTVAYDARTGRQLWAVHDTVTPPGQMAAPTSMTASPDGRRLYVTGNSAHTFLSADSYTIAYETSSGAVAWRSRYNGAVHARNGAAVVSADSSRLFILSYMTYDDFEYVNYGVQAYET